METSPNLPGKPKSRPTNGEWFDLQNDAFEPTTTNILGNTLSLNSSDTEIAIDAWEELGENDFPSTAKQAQNSRSPHKYSGKLNKTFENNFPAVQEFNALVHKSEKSSPERHFYKNNDFPETTDSIATITSGESLSTTTIIADIPRTNDHFEPRAKFRGTEKNVIGQAIAGDDSENQKSNTKRSKVTSTSKEVACSRKSKESTTTKGKGNIRKRLPSPPPGKHRITIYDSSVEKHGGLILAKDTPYLCNFVAFQDEHHKRALPSGPGYYHVYISDKEFRLLQSFLPPPHRKCAKPLEEQEQEVIRKRTLFGWVSSASGLKEELQSSKQQQNPSQVVQSQFKSNIAPEYQRSCSKLNHFTPKASIAEVGEGTTDSDFLLNVVRTTCSSIETQTHTLTDIEWNLMQDYHSKVSSKTGIRIPIEKNLEQKAGNMRQSILNTSETSIILMNTIFKDVFNDPNVGHLLEIDPSFQDFISSKNEIDALGKAACIFGAAKDNIQNYLGQLKREFSSAPASYTNLKARVPPSSETNESHQRKISSETNFDRKGRSLDREMNVWRCKTDFGTIPTPKYFQISIISKPGIILETIYCNNYEFSMVYSGGPERINILESATREKAETVNLNPQRLLEMIDRNASFASGRIISSKYYISFVSQQLGNLVQKFISGKYSKVLRSSCKWNSKVAIKLRAINTFSGVILQSSTSFFSVCKKIKSAIEKTMQLDDVLRIPRLPGLGLQDTVTVSSDLNNNHLLGSSRRSINNNFRVQHAPEYGLPLGSKMPMKDAVLDLSNCVNDIDAILVTIKNSLDSLSIGVSVKDTYRKRIEYFFLAVKQLEFGHDIDFGTVIMCLASNAAIVQSLSNVVPTVDVEMRSRILASLGHLNWGCGELVKLVKKICLLSSFVCSKSIARLRKMIALEKARRQNKRRWFRKKKVPGNAATTTRSKKDDLKINIQRIGEQRKEKEETKLKQLKAELTQINSLE